MTHPEKCVLDGALSVWGLTYCYTLSETNEIVQIMAGLLTSVVLLLRLWNMAKGD